LRVPGPSLARRLRARIVSEGPITFAAFMDAALYDPEGGFYARGSRLGRGGAFSTAPTRHPAFADAVADEARQCSAALGDPDAFAIVEVGPGDGSLARDLAERLPGGRIVLVERAEGMRRAQEQALAGLPVTWAAAAREVRVEAGLVVANEVFDDQPVRLLEPPHEILVGVDESGGFRETRRPASPELLALAPEPRPGGRYAVRPDAPDLLAAIAGTVRRGRVLIVDYGGEGAEVHRGREPVRTYVGGVRGGSPLQAPGRQNLTADVDFAQLRRAAAALGLRELRYSTQGDWLRDHGARVPPGGRAPGDDLLAVLLDGAQPFKTLLLSA
jgi:NADH dehydrogenase [ubiquinone] 1 alpha subcomplex assembly factor 7